jgi:predicted Rossmann-fold nucleotide-binding protein
VTAPAGLPFAPVRWGLYTPAELFTGFDPASPSSWTATADFAIYRHAVVESHRAVRDPFVSMMQSLHDHSITEAIRPLVAGRRVAAIMGGHKLARTAPAYRDVVRLARALTRADVTVSSGGGPGAMEAAHLGASLAPAEDAELDRALEALSVAPVVPELKSVVRPDGTIDEVLCDRAHAWFRPAYELSRWFGGGPASLAVPTWHYGHEPTTPLATHVAKYFQNAIREEGLLALAQQGVVYAEGRAGTLQEIFQDATQNYYRSFAYFSPMVLLGIRYWTETLPVLPLLEKLLLPDDRQRLVLVTDDVDEAADFIAGFEPPA